MYACFSSKYIEEGEKLGGPIEKLERSRKKFYPVIISFSNTTSHVFNAAHYERVVQVVGAGAERDTLRAVFLRFSCGDALG